VDFHDIMDQQVGPNFIKLLLVYEPVIIIEFMVALAVHEKYFQQVSLVVIVFQLLF
jgi:hypothetical protein